MAQDMPESPAFCFSCGYDLTGLDLPRACPECGRLADPAAQTEAARQWFARGAAWRWWVGKAPPGVLYVLHDPDSLRRAHLRQWRWLWLPMIVIPIIVVVRLSLFRGNVFMWLISPMVYFAFWIAVLSSYEPCQAIVQALARRAASRHGQPELARSVKAALSLVAPLLGLALWTVVLLTLSVALFEGDPGFGLAHSHPSPPLPKPWWWEREAASTLVTLAAGLWVLGHLVGWARLVSLDSAGLIFRPRVGAAALLACVGIVVPVLAFLVWLS